MVEGFLWNLVTLDVNVRFFFRPQIPFLTFGRSGSVFLLFVIDNLDHIEKLRLPKLHGLICDEALTFEIVCESMD